MCEDWLRGIIGIRRANSWPLRIPNGSCFRGPLLLVQCQLISINKLEFAEEQHELKWELVLLSEIQA
jgi:hypothetical protein